MNKKSLIIVFLLFLTVEIFAQNENSEIFKDKDRICFVGNSITHGGFYHSYINLFYLTRYPDLDLRVYNCGISGNVVPGGIKRAQDDILSNNPSVITIMFGMNDIAGGNYVENPTPEIYDQRKESIRKYKNNIDTLTDILTAKGARLIYFTPTIYDETSEMDVPNNTGRNEELAKCRKIILAKGKETGFPVVDFYTILDSLNEVLQKDDPRFTIVGRDRVHPGVDGHFVMAYQFLKRQSVDPYVSKIEIDAKTMIPGNCYRSRIMDILSTQNGLAFSCREDALPFPVPENLSALNWVPFMDMNIELLTVSNLPKAEYLLKIDNTVIDTFTNEALSKGVNLAKYSYTPQYKQAKILSDVNEWRRDLEANRLRTLALYDYGWFNNDKNLSMADRIEIFDEKFETVKEKPYYGYLRNQADNYILFKPLENSSKKLLEDINASLNVLNQPVAHKFSVEKIVPE